MMLEIRTVVFMGCEYWLEEGLERAFWGNGILTYHDWGYIMIGVISWLDLHLLGLHECVHLPNSSDFMICVCLSLKVKFYLNYKYFIRKQYMLITWDYQMKVSKYIGKSKWTVIPSLKEEHWLHCGVCPSKLFYFLHLRTQYGFIQNVVPLICF